MRTIRTEVSHIMVNEYTEHIVFMYQTSVYIRIQNRKDKDTFYAIQNKFESFEEARGYKRGYIAAYTWFGFNNLLTYMETVSIDGFTMQEHHTAH